MTDTFDVERAKADGCEYQHIDQSWYPVKLVSDDSIWHEEDWGYVVRGQDGRLQFAPIARLRNLSRPAADEHVVAVQVVVNHDVDGDRTYVHCVLSWWMTFTADDPLWYVGDDASEVIPRTEIKFRDGAVVAYKPPGEEWVEVVGGDELQRLRDIAETLAGYERCMNDANDERDTARKSLAKAQETIGLNADALIAARRELAKRDVDRAGWGAAARYWRDVFYRLVSAWPRDVELPTWARQPKPDQERPTPVEVTTVYCPACGHANTPPLTCEQCASPLARQLKPAEENIAVPPPDAPGETVDGVTLCPLGRDQWRAVAVAESNRIGQLEQQLAELREKLALREAELSRADAAKDDLQQQLADLKALWERASSVFCAIFGNDRVGYYVARHFQSWPYWTGECWVSEGKPKHYPTFTAALDVLPAALAALEGE